MLFPRFKMFSPKCVCPLSPHLESQEIYVFACPENQDVCDSNLVHWFVSFAGKAKYRLDQVTSQPSTLTLGFHGDYIQQLRRNFQAKSGAVSVGQA